MALPISIADAVVTELAGGTFSLQFTPERRVLPDYELADLKELRVTVVPAAEDIENVSRALSQHDVQIDIGIQKKLSGNIDDEVLQLHWFVGEVGDFLNGRKLQGFPQALWVRATNELIYSTEHLAEQRTFTSVLSVTYRVLK